MKQHLATPDPCKPWRRGVASGLTALLVLAFAGYPAARAEQPQTAGTKHLRFVPEGNGHYRFDTGILSGRLRCDGQAQGLSSLVHAPSDVELAYGGNHPGIFSYYRIFSTNKRFGDAARDWPTESKLLDDGAVQVDWPPTDEHPLRLRAVYRWTAADRLDLETTATPLEDMPGFEVFLSSYFAKGFDAWVYVEPRRFTDDPAELIRTDVNPLIEGTYLMFPRDRHAAQMVFDGRWELPPHPVQWSLGRWLAGPLALRRSESTSLVAAVMAPAEDCFAVATPYNKDPPDRVAGHVSLYLSLFGQDLKAGETAKTHSRLVVSQGMTNAQAIEAYRKYDTGE